MKTRIIATLLTMILALSLVACGGDSSEEADSSEDAAVEEVSEDAEAADDDGIIDFEADAFTVKYTKHEIAKDWEGNPCLIYYFEFTNNGEEATSAMVTSYIQCFQNGVECETTFLDKEIKEYDNFGKDIKPGTTLEVCNIYLLEDDSEITLEASDWVSLSDDMDTQTITVE